MTHIDPIHSYKFYDHRKLVLSMIEAALKRTKERKPTKPRVDTPREGSWAETANAPIPDHVREFHARKNPLYGAIKLKPKT